jgi:hypothetical protein
VTLHTYEDEYSRRCTKAQVVLSAALSVIEEHISRGSQCPPGKERMVSLTKSKWSIDIGIAQR